MSEHENSDTTDTLCVAGGLALMVLGAGLLIARPGIRRLVQQGLTTLSPSGESPLSGAFVSNGLGGLLPDVERYLKMRAM